MDVHHTHVQYVYSNQSVRKNGEHNELKNRLCTFQLRFSQDLGVVYKAQVQPHVCYCTFVIYVKQNAKHADTNYGNR